MREPVKYLTDDRDARERNVFWILQGGNGDWYVATAPENEFPGGKMVRLCTSGGASSRCPGLTGAMHKAYEAIAATADTKREREEQEVSLAQEQSPPVDLGPVRKLVVILSDIPPRSSRGGHEWAATNAALRALPALRALLAKVEQQDAAQPHSIAVSMKKASRKGYHLCEIHQQEYLQYCSGCALQLPGIAERLNAEIKALQEKNAEAQDTIKNLGEYEEAYREAAREVERLQGEVTTLVAKNQELKMKVGP